METPSKKRPTSVTVIGWIFVVVSILMIFSGAMGFIAYSFIQQMGNSGMPQMPENMPRTFNITFTVLKAIFKHFGLLALLQIAFAIFILFAGIQFLKLRAWARTALEIVSWIGLVYIVGNGIFLMVSWISITSSIPFKEDPQDLPAMFNIFGAVMGMVVTIVFAVPIIVIIKFLRGRIIKEAVTY